MRALSPADILTVWERGLRRNNGGRALAILAAACPEMAVEQLAGLTVGRRDALLLEARELTSGAEMAASVRCPACDEALEFTARTGDLRLPLPADQGAAVCRWAQAESQVTFRLPTAEDLEVIGELPAPDGAEQALLARCVLTAELAGQAVPAAALPADVVTAVSAEMIARDPQAEVLLSLACPACGHGWQTPFDIASFFWAEIAALARRLLREVDLLARTYGWRESDILALSTSRRQAYLEMAQE